MFKDRCCPKCSTRIEGKEKHCPKCGTRVGRESATPEFPGSYKGYIKK